MQIGICYMTLALDICFYSVNFISPHQVQNKKNNILFPLICLHKLWQHTSIIPKTYPLTREQLAFFFFDGIYLTAQMWKELCLIC